MNYKYMLIPRSSNELEIHFSKNSSTIHVESFTRNLLSEDGRFGREFETDAEFCHRARSWALNYLQNLTQLDEKFEKFRDICQVGTWFDEDGPTSLAD